MFRTVTSLFLFGALSPLSAPLPFADLSTLLEIAPPTAFAPVSLELGFSASGAIAVDLLSGRELFARHADQPRPIASLAKIMTAVLIVENHALTEVVTIPTGVLSVNGSTAEFRPGERYTVRALLGALLVGSSNDAAYSLALFHSGTIENFVAEMNTRAQTLGLRRTRFANPMGFDSAEQESTPRDLAWLAMYAWKLAPIREFAGKREHILRDYEGKREMVLHNTNRLLLSHPGSFFGLKTGTTELAGGCLISLARVRGRPTVFVILKSADRYEDTLTLLHLLNEAHA